MIESGAEPFDPEQHPVVTAAELEPGAVYVVASARYAATFNYMGTREMVRIGTMEPVLTHEFYGPRGDLRIQLAVRRDGSFTDATGRDITVRRYMGDDPGPPFTVALPN